jgi:hypothetical protein
MANNPYKDGKKSYSNGHSHNPYMSTIARDEWQQGYDEAEAAATKEQDEHARRRDGLWEVPERARDEYMAMEDELCQSTVLRFMLAMHPEETA